MIFKKAVVFVLCLLSALLLSGCLDKFLQPQDPADLRNCASSSDCVVVVGKHCCSCGISINSKYADYWEKRSRDDCSNVMCAQCQSFENPVATCIESNCTIREGGSSNE